MIGIEIKQNTSNTKKDKKLKSFTKRIERLEEEKYNITNNIKEAFSKGTDMGYDPKVIRKVLILCKIDVDERLEQKVLLDTYRNKLSVY